MSAASSGQPAAFRHDLDNIARSEEPDGLTHWSSWPPGEFFKVMDKLRPEALRGRCSFRLLGCGTGLPKANEAPGSADDFATIVGDRDWAASIAPSAPERG